MSFFDRKMMNLGLRAVSLGVDRIPDKVWDSLPGFKQKELKEAERKRDRRKSTSNVDGGRRVRVNGDDIDRRGSRRRRSRRRYSSPPPPQPELVDEEAMIGGGYEPPTRHQSESHGRAGTTERYGESRPEHVRTGQTSARPYNPMDYVGKPWGVMTNPGPYDNQQHSYNVQSSVPQPPANPYASYPLNRTSSSEARYTYHASEPSPPHSPYPKPPQSSANGAMPPPQQPYYADPRHPGPPPQPYYNAAPYGHDRPPHFRQPSYSQPPSRTGSMRGRQDDYPRARSHSQPRRRESRGRDDRTEHQGHLRGAAYKAKSSVVDKTDRAFEKAGSGADKKGIGPANVLGAVAGGWLGSEVTSGKRTGALAGAVLGGFGAEAFERERKKKREGKRRHHGGYDGAYDDGYDSYDGYESY